MSKFDPEARKLIRARMGITIPLRESRPSTTRSDAACGALRRQELTEDTLASNIKAMQGATMLERRAVNGPDGKYSHHETVEVPDWKTRTRGVELQAEIEGWKYAPQKAQDQDPLVVVINKLPEVVREKLLQTVTNRLLPLTSEGHES